VTGSPTGLHRRPHLHQRGTTSSDSTMTDASSSDNSVDGQSPQSPSFLSLSLSPVSVLCDVLLGLYQIPKNYPLDLQLNDPLILTHLSLVREHQRDCMRNHAVAMGGQAFNGSDEYMASSRTRSSARRAGLPPQLPPPHREHVGGTGLMRTAHLLPPTAPGRYPRRRRSSTSTTTTRPR
jgi:hypothetical protein